jgi:hypothetical protein
MSRSRLISVAVLVFASGLLMPQAGFAQTKKAKPKVTYYSIKADTILRVRLDEELSSKTAYVGQTFKSTTVDPVYSTGGVLLIPQASSVSGRVTAVQKAQKDGKPGMLSVSFRSITLPNGRKATISGSLAESGKRENNSVDNEGTVSGNKMKNRNLKWIGGGAAGGAVIGGIAGGGTGALIGAGVGALAGLIGKNQTKGKEAEVDSGTEFGILVNRAFSLPRYKEAAASNQ